MAIDSATAPPPAADGFRALAARQSPRQGAERLNQLVESMEAVAAELDSPARSRTERTVLRARFNDLQRQVNLLDGIVAAEGFESAGQKRVARSAEGLAMERTSPAQAPPRSDPAARDGAAQRVEPARAGSPQAAAPDRAEARPEPPPTQAPPRESDAAPAAPEPAQDDHIDVMA